MDAKQLSAIAQSFSDIESSKDGNTSIKHKFLGEQLQLTYTTLFYYVEEKGLHSQTAREVERSVDMVNNFIAKASEKYKEITGKSLKLKPLSQSDKIEIISATANSPRKVAYYWRYFGYEIG